MGREDESERLLELKKLILHVDKVLGFLVDEIEDVILEDWGSHE